MSYKEVHVTPEGQQAKEYIKKGQWVIQDTKMVKETKLQDG